VKRDAFRYESFYASASTDGERLYTIARSGKIVALDASSGRVLWTDNVSSLGYSTPAVGRDRIFVGDFNGGLRAYRKTDGRLIWRTHVGGRILGGAVVVGDLVFFSTLETETYAARASDGKIVWHFPIGKYSPGIATERAYYFTLNGILVAFRGKDGPK
jgi:outer membrane protein assembly factor BamB